MESTRSPVYHRETNYQSSTRGPNYQSSYKDSNQSSPKKSIREIAADFLAITMYAAKKSWNLFPLKIESVADVYSLVYRPLDGAVKILDATGKILSVNKNESGCKTMISAGKNGFAYNFLEVPSRFALDMVGATLDICDLYNLSQLFKNPSSKNPSRIYENRIYEKPSWSDFFFRTLPMTVLEVSDLQSLFFKYNPNANFSNPPFPLSLVSRICQTDLSKYLLISTVVSGLNKIWANYQKICDFERTVTSSTNGNRIINQLYEKNIPPVLSIVSEVFLLASNLLKAYSSSRASDLTQIALTTASTVFNVLSHYADKEIDQLQAMEMEGANTFSRLTAGGDDDDDSNDDDSDVASHNTPPLHRKTSQ